MMIMILIVTMMTSKCMATIELKRFAFFAEIMATLLGPQSIPYLRRHATLRCSPKTSTHTIHA